VDEQEFELESANTPAGAWKPSIPPVPVLEPAPEPSPPSPTPASPPEAPAPAQAATAAPSPSSVPDHEAAQDALLSPTLGELYFNQGFTDKAIEVYRELAAREPGNERVGARLRELQALQRSLEESAPPVPAREAAEAPDPARERREAIERTIGRLEGLLAAIRKG
jgi:hypothetical protein